MVLNEQNFESEVLKSSLPVLVDFFADWCQPCQMAAPVLEELAKEYEGKVKFGKLNVEASPQLSVKYQAMSIPMVLIFKNGKEIGRLVGFEGKDKYQQLINEVIKRK